MCETLEIVAVPTTALYKYLLFYHFFQNSNGFAPGGVGGLATITHHLLGGKINWSILMVTFNITVK